MTVIRGAQAPRFHLPGVEFTGLAAPSRGSPIQLVNAGDTAAELYVAIRAGFTGTLADGTNISPPWAR